MKRSLPLKVAYFLLVMAFGTIFPLVCSAGNTGIEKLASFVTSQAVWQSRREAIRNGILTGANLFPVPNRTPLRPVFSNRRVRSSYTVENIAFEATPGFYVFGNLYRPLHPVRKVPAILVANGHFKERGWYARTRPENQILCANLAAMGAVVFTYDMVGWGDSRQLEHDVNNVLRLQLWDSIRALDFVESFPEVDSHRIGITGASGGATQAILLAAVDTRVRASMPVAMISSDFSGNEPCEDGMDVRKVPGFADTNNAEIAAAVAPHPLMIISDGADWTKSFPKDDFPFIRHIYELFGSAERVQNLHFPEGKHDYGPIYRQAAYQFFSKAFRTFPPPASESLFIESQRDQAVLNWIQLPATFPVKNEESVGFLTRTYVSAHAVSGIVWKSVTHVFSYRLRFTSLK